MMIGLIGRYFTFTILLGFLLFFSSCGSALHNEGRTAFPHEQIKIQNTTQEMELWQTEHLAIQYQIKDLGPSFTITGTVHIKDRITLSFPVLDFLYVYVNLLDRNGIATSKRDIFPATSRFNTVSNQISFSQTLQKDENTAKIAFSYWGIFRERGITYHRDSADWEVYYNPFEKRPDSTTTQKQ